MYLYNIAFLQYSKMMAWIVELLDGRVRQELESLPLDMQARFRRIVELIQGYGLERVHEPHVKHLEGLFVGDAHEGKRRNFKGSLRYSESAPRRSCPGIRKENAEDAKKRD
jgi:hypothetical protein